MFPGIRQLRVAAKTFTLQRAGTTFWNSTHVHPLRIRTFASTSHAHAAESPNIKDTPLYQQLATNPSAIHAIKEFGQVMKDHAIEFSTDRMPSTIQLIKLMANTEFRNAVQKLQRDLEKAGVDVNPENAMQMLESFKSMQSGTNSN